MKTIIRITTVAGSLKGLLKGQLSFMNEHYDIIGVAYNNHNLFERIQEEEGIRTINVNMTRKITPLSDLKATFHLYRIIRREKPFIVHSHTPKAGTLGMLAARLAGVSNRLHTIAGLPLLESTGSKRRLLNLVEKFTYSCATIILPNSFGMKKIILQEGFCKASKLRVLGNGSSNGIDVAHFSNDNVNVEEAENLRKELNLCNESIVFLFIGRVVKDKGINELVKAFEHIYNENPKCKLLIVGPSEDHLDPISNETKLIIKSNDNIHAVGHKDDIRPYVFISDIFVFPSYREGFPNVVLQASCMEKPCIVSDINGCNEIITHNYNGLIVPPKDTNALKDAMIYLLNNPDKTRKLASNTRSNIVNKYKREVIWNEMLELYKSLE